MFSLQYAYCLILFLAWMISLKAEIQLVKLGLNECIDNIQKITKNTFTA